MNNSDMPAMIIGEKYNWISQPERLIYLGHNFSSNGFWHQFSLVESPCVVWCETQDSDLDYIEATKALEANNE